MTSGYRMISCWARCGAIGSLLAAFRSWRRWCGICQRSTRTISRTPWSRFAMCSAGSQRSSRRMTTTMTRSASTTPPSRRDSPMWRKASRTCQRRPTSRSKAFGRSLRRCSKQSARSGRASPAAGRSAWTPSRPRAPPSVTTWPSAWTSCSASSGGRAPEGRRRCRTACCRASRCWARRSRSCRRACRPSTPAPTLRTPPSRRMSIGRPRRCCGRRARRPYASTS
mmetsp:Transcript_113922/g.318258  ORF Transcript_113922/g.318258 Transcript_113922/m.318258 type:complete len:225 (+) Transcript_113922:392-1066(+)